MNKKLSTTSSASLARSPLARILARGQQKVDFKEDKARLLMHFSDKDHRRIARLIAKWLEESENTNKGP